MKLPRGYLSPSQVQRYMACPRCYFEEYVLQRERKIGVALPIGGAVHRGIEFARRRLLYGVAWETEEVVEVALDHFEREHQEVDLGKFVSVGAARDEVARLLEWSTPRLLALDAQRRLSNVEVWVCSDPALLTEPEKRHPHLPYDKVAAAFPVPVKSRLDAIYAEQRVVSDLKTASSKGMPQGAAFQLGFYLLPFVFHNRPAAGLIDVLVKTKEPALQHYALSDVDAAVMHATITDVAECISEGYFPARPGMFCSYDHGFPALSVAVDGFKEAA